MTEEQIKALNRRRGSAKRSLTAYENFLVRYNPDKDYPNLEKRFSEIENVRKDFLAIQSELEELVDDEEVYSHRVEFDDAYFEAYSKAYKLLFASALHKTSIADTSDLDTQIKGPSENSGTNLATVINQPTSVTQTIENSQFRDQLQINNNNAPFHDHVPITHDPQPVQANSFTNQAGNSSPNYAIANKSCLPTISLPNFNGSFDSWLGFYDLFNSLVHGDSSISPIRKLFYLKSCLSGEAASVIASIESSAQNYEVAWKLLRDRYDDRKLIREKYIQALLDTRVISKDFSTRSFVDHIQKNLRALQTLGEPIDSWDSILVVILRNKLNSYLRERWEDHCCGTSKPTVDQMITFLTKRAHFETVRAQSFPKTDNQSNLNFNNNNGGNHNKNNRNHKPKLSNPSKQTFAVTLTSNRCLHCSSKEHYVHKCRSFIDLTPFARYEIAKRAGWCINCLRNTHTTSHCNFSKCRICNQRHSTLLHFEKNNDMTAQNNGIVEPRPSELVSQVTTLHAFVSPETLLATALVDIVNPQGLFKTCRVFLDAGSQAHFITEATAKFLNLDLVPVNISVSGVDDICTNVKYMARATLKSRFNKFNKNIEFLLVPQISKAMPSAAIDPALIEIPKNILLADPEFGKPLPVDALIGVNLFYKLLCVGQIQLKNHPDAILQKTQLGWVIAGELNYAIKRPSVSCHLALNNYSLDNVLRRFWEVEELPAAKLLSPEEKLCEDHYLLNTTRDSTGRYVVRLPFNNNLKKLGQSYNSALRRFHSLEKRLVRDESIGKDYIDFLREYQKLGHMSVTNDLPESPGFYLPHHAVLKQESLTTKTRVVFDGSAKTSTGISLNDALMVGPKLQDDLFNILIRYRSHTFVLTADIEKMYRQISVHPDDAKYQKILFRSSPHESINTFILNTVTYGTACASYLAIRSLQQLADDEGQSYPLAAATLKRDFYVDDLLTGTNTRHEAEILRDELNQIMKRGGFNLRKWASNDPSLLENCNENPSSTHMSLDPDTSIKTLGIHWNAREDIIFYTVNISKVKAATKRAILSQIAQLFDPLGLIGPVILHAKIIMQSLWKTGIQWDESIPLDLYTSWSTYLRQLPLIERLKFTRCITIPNPINIQMHGFCDASEKAYGACIYLRSTDSKGKCHIRLICSKSRVAPVSSISLPRLELCGALILARLFDIVKRSFSVNTDDIFLWSDSTISLHWINTPPHRLKTFTSNRVAEIQRLTATCHWRHVSSLDNPADLISRGQLPADFLQTELWQQGPAWLHSDQSNWPKIFLPNITIPDLKPEPPNNTMCMQLQLRGYDLITRYESFAYLTRIIAYLLRFINNTRCKISQRALGDLKSSEIIVAQNTIIKMVQLSSFSSEINCLKKGNLIPESSKLIPLSPFLDSIGILRVGGRLASSELPDGQRHPILLPSDHHITRTIIRLEHYRLNHAGAQSTLYSVRQIYWPLGGRNVTRKIIHKCLKCFRAKPRFANHIMGDLPSYRVSQARPFLRVGVDYCGPLYIKERRHRNRQKLKVYVAIYVCMATKATHLELVSDLTTEAFIASLKRLFSRRGKSTDIFSDNATSFVGASREIAEIHELFNSIEHKNAVQRYLRDEKIDWHFIPPRAPHFGGLWEAAVKSFKRHLIRTVGNTLLTYEQLETYVIEIEAILNSRPISPLSSNPNDILPLTPGHFLIGASLTSVPEADLTEVNLNRLSAWQHAQQLKQHFWQRWSKEYLHQLIARPIQQTKIFNLEIGMLVIIAEDNLPPLHWSLGRISAVHPGKDGVVRTATVKTATGEYKRCTKKLCPLPFEDDSTVSNH